MRLLVVGLLALTVMFTGMPPVSAQPDGPAGAPATFHNPIADVFDPTIVTHNGEYYLIGTSSSNKLSIRRSPTVAGLRTAAPVIVWTGPEQPPAGELGRLGCCMLWSPVLQKVRGVWYIYLSVTNARPPREVTSAGVYVLEGNRDDPLGPYTLKAELRHWDRGDPGPWLQGRVGPSVTELPDGRLYFTATTFGFYIQQMTEPWALKPGSLVQVDDGTPSLAWEGGRSEISRPFVRVSDGQAKVFVPYSSENHIVNRTTGGPCWSFCVGMFINTDGNLLNKSSWRKSPQPVFAGGPDTGLYKVLAVGTFTSPDGAENWMVYNASDAAGTSYEERDTFIKRFTFRPDGTPDFADPPPLRQALEVPSGERGSPAAATPGGDFDFSTGADGWFPLAGAWSACAGRYCATGTGENLAVTGDLRWTDYTVQAKVTVDGSPNGSGVNVVARAVSANRLFNLELLRTGEGEGRWAIARNGGGQWETLASGPYAWSAGRPYWLRLDVNAGKLTGLISADGVVFSQLGVVKLGPRVASGDFGKAGLRTWGGSTAAFDDVIITPTRPSWGFYSGPGWPGLTIDAGSPLAADEPNSANFCENAHDDYCVGGFALKTTAAITTSGVANALAGGYYQTEKWGDTVRNDGRFHYVIPSLTPGRGYSVRLHFAEIHYDAAGKRTFDVKINGRLVLDELDKVAAAGAPRKALVRQFAATADEFGHIVIALLPGTTANRDHNPTVSAVQVLPVTIRLNSGSDAAAGPFKADSDGVQRSTTEPIDVDGVRGAGPVALYQSERLAFGDPGDFHRVISGLAPGGQYRVRLHFAEIFYAEAGKRYFNVDLNDERKLTNFDKVHEAGGPLRAVIREFVGTADANGVLDIHFTKGTVPGVDGNPTVSGIEVLSG